jgi:hypothetical protein
MKTKNLFLTASSLALFLPSVIGSFPKNSFVLNNKQLVSPIIKKSALVGSSSFISEATFLSLASARPCDLVSVATPNVNIGGVNYWFGKYEILSSRKIYDYLYANLDIYHNAELADTYFDSQTITFSTNSYSIGGGIHISGMYDGYYGSLDATVGWTTATEKSISFTIRSTLYGNSNSAAAASVGKSVSPTGLYHEYIIDNYCTSIIVQRIGDQFGQFVTAQKVVNTPSTVVGRYFSKISPADIHYGLPAYC